MYLRATLRCYMAIAGGLVSQVNRPLARLVYTDDSGVMLGCETATLLDLSLVSVKAEGGSESHVQSGCITTPAPVLSGLRGVVVRLSSRVLTGGYPLSRGIRCSTSTVRNKLRFGFGVERTAAPVGRRVHVVPGSFHSTYTRITPSDDVRSIWVGFRIS